MTTEPIIIQGVEIPVPRSGPLTDFVTPDWTAVVEFYPEYCRLVVAREGAGEPWDPQPYLLTFAKYLERRKARPGRSADEWTRRMIEHFGMAWMESVIKDMKAAKVDAVGGD